MRVGKGSFLGGTLKEALKKISAGRRPVRAMRAMMEQHHDKDEELRELATEPDRWFTGLKRFVETEPALDLSSVFLGKD